MLTMPSTKELALSFAKFFHQKDVEGIGSLLADDFALFDPSAKWIRGKQAVMQFLKTQFQQTAHVSYEVLHVYEADQIGILEFKITFDDLVFQGVDIMQWEEGKMIELRCYYYLPQSEILKPLSAQAKLVIPGTRYQHYSGKYYEIISVGRHSESLEESVVYKAMYDQKDVWIRPLGMFLGEVEINGQLQPRFKKIDI